MTEQLSGPLPRQNGGLGLGVATLDSEAIRLLVRTLRMRRATTGFGANLLDETIAYDLVWPN